MSAANVRGWTESVLQDIDSGKTEPIDCFFPLSMAIGGCMNSPKDTAINGKSSYARILIQRKEISKNEDNRDKNQN